MSSCDGTCVGLAVGLGLLFFVVGCLLLVYFKDYIAPTEDEDKQKATGSQGKQAEPDIEQGPAGETANGSQEIKVEIVGGSMKRRRSSNHEAAVSGSAVFGVKRSDNAEAVSLGQGEPGKKRYPSENAPGETGEQFGSRRNRRRSTNNDNFVDASDITLNSSNEPKVDGSTVTSGGLAKTSSMRSRRTSSNNDRPVDMYDIIKGPPPTDAEVEAARKRAASLEKKLEEASKAHSALLEASKRLQQEIADLSAKNNEMRLDDDKL